MKRAAVSFEAMFRRLEARSHVKAQKEAEDARIVGEFFYKFDLNQEHRQNKHGSGGARVNQRSRTGLKLRTRGIL